MATLTIGTASGGFFNFRGANTTPYAMGSDVVIQNTGGDINTTGGYEGVVCTQLTFQASGYTTTSSLYGNVWNSSGNSVTSSVAVSAATDTTAPFGSKTFNLTDKFFSTPQTIYVGYSRAAASPTAWDCVNGDNSTRVGNTAGSAPNGLTASGTGTIYRRLVGTLTYTLYDAGNISQSASQPSNLAITLTFAGNSPTYAKNISVDWGDGTTSTATVAAGVVPTAITKTYASAGAKTITTTLSHASTSVGIPDLTLTSSPTVYTVPGAPTSLSATPGNASVALSWVAPSYVGSGTVNYALYRGATLVYNSTGTSFTDTGLANGTSYSYTVYASNTWGTGGVSNTATTTPRTVPNAPQTLTVTPGVTRAAASWSAPSSNGGSAITSYEYSLDGTNWTNNSTSLSAAITSLSKYSSYTFYVRAVNVAGNSTSTTASFTTFGGRYAVYNGTTFVYKYAQKYDGSAWSDAPVRVYNGTIWEYTEIDQAPDAPVLSGVFISPADAEFQSVHNLSWTTPANNGSAITTYNIETSIDNINWGFSYSPGLTNSATAGADIGAEYYTRVRAVNAIGQGTPSSSYYVSD